MAFLNPLYLWALLGLAVPVAIHLWSKKEGRTIKIGSIKFLKESDPKQASSIKINEIWLLILRMLALSLLVFILAGPVWEWKGSPSALTYLVDPSLLGQEEMSRFLDTIDSGIEVRILSTGFPEYNSEDEVIHEDIPVYWKLAPEMEKLNSDSVVVFTAGYISGLKGRRPQTGQHINWIQVIPDERINAPIAAVQKGTQLEIISVSGDHSRLEINKEIRPVEINNVPTVALGDSLIIDQNGNGRYIPLRIADTLKVGLFNAEELKEQTIYIRSSLRAISEFLNIPIHITEISREDSFNEQKDLLIWLSDSSVDEYDIPILKWKPDSLSNSLIEQGTKKDVYHLTRYINSENIIEEHFAEQLLSLLYNDKELEEEIRKFDRRVMPLEEIQPVAGSVGGNITINKVLDISKYFWFLVLIILIAERGLSAYRKQ